MKPKGLTQREEILFIEELIKWGNEIKEINMKTAITALLMLLWRFKSQRTGSSVMCLVKSSSPAWNWVCHSPTNVSC